MPRRQQKDTEQEGQSYSVVVGLAPLHSPLPADIACGAPPFPLFAYITALDSGRKGAGILRKTEKRSENNTFNWEYLSEFSKKFETALLIYSRVWGKLIHEKNLKSKISWHCNFETCTVYAPRPCGAQIKISEDKILKHIYQKVQ
jgi:hypothetical protein